MTSLIVSYDEWLCYLFCSFLRTLEKLIIAKLKGQNSNLFSETQKFSEKEKHLLELLSVIPPDSNKVVAQINQHIIQINN